MKKLICLMAVTVTGLTLVLAGCGEKKAPAEKEGAKASQPPADAGKVTDAAKDAGKAVEGAAKDAVKAVDPLVKDAGKTADAAVKDAGKATDAVKKDAEKKAEAPKELKK